MYYDIFIQLVGMW